MEPLKMKQQERFERPEISSINQALRVLDDAADTSAEEIKEMLNRDYRGLQRIFSPRQHEAGAALQSLREATAESFADMRGRASRATRRAVQRVDESAHQNPWTFIASAAAASALLGFLAGRRAR